MIDFDIKKPRMSTVNRPFGSPDSVLPPNAEQDILNMNGNNEINISFMPRVQSDRNRIYFYFGRSDTLTTTDKDFFFYYNDSEGEGEWLRRIYTFPDDTILNEGYVGSADGDNTFYFTAIIADGGVPNRRTRLVTWQTENFGNTWSILYDRDVSSMIIPGHSGTTEVNGYAMFVTKSHVYVIAHLSTLNEATVGSRLVAWKDAEIAKEFNVPTNGLVSSPGVRARAFDPETETGFFQYHDDFNNTIDTWYFQKGVFSQPVESFTGPSVPAAVDMWWFPRKSFLIMSTLATGPEVIIVNPNTNQPVFTDETFFRVGIIWSNDGGKNLFSTDRVVIDDRRRALTSMGYNYKTRVNLVQNFDGNKFIEDVELMHTQNSYAFASDIENASTYTELIRDLESGTIDFTLPTKRHNRRRAKQYLIQTKGSNINLPGA